MIKRMRRAWLFVVSECPSRGYWKLPPPPQPSCMLSFLCNDQKDWEEPGHLKFLNALQEDTGNNFSYLVPMNIVNLGVGGGQSTLGYSVPPPPPLNPHVCYYFYVMIKGLRRAWSFEVSESPSGGDWKWEKLFLASSWRAFRNFKWPGSSQSLWSLHKNESMRGGGGGGQFTLG